MIYTIMDFIRTMVRLLCDLARFLWLFVRPQSALATENLFLRKQLAMYQERNLKPHRPDIAFRVALVLRSRLFDWKHALVVIKPQTLGRWHRQGFHLFWRWKPRPGRPPVPTELKRLIREMALSNPIWGEERITNELLLKPGIRVSPRTVCKYMPKRPDGQPGGDQRWSTFVRNHAAAIQACDFCVVVTATFRQLYVLVVIEHQTRRIVHCNVRSTRLRNGHYNNFEKLSRRITATGFSSTIAMVFFRRSLMNLLLT
jgi:putative transposase